MSFIAAVIGFSAAALSQSTAKSDRPATSWTFGCSGDGCRAEAATQNANGQRIVSMWVAMGPQNRPYVGVIAPLGLHIPNGVVLSFDQGQTQYRRLNLLSCHSEGCRAVLALDGDLEQRLRASSEVAVVIRDSQSRTDLALTMPLWGFSAQLDQLKSQADG